PSGATPLRRRADGEDPVLRVPPPRPAGAHRGGSGQARLRRQRLRRSREAPVRLLLSPESERWSRPPCDPAHDQARVRHGRSLERPTTPVARCGEEAAAVKTAPVFTAGTRGNAHVVRAFARSRMKRLERKGSYDAL